MVGLFTVAWVGLHTVSSLWLLLCDRTVPLLSFAYHFFWRAVSLIAIPLVVYLACFYAHFALLPLSGPGDNHMSLEFQLTLDNNPYSNMFAGAINVFPCPLCSSLLSRCALWRQGLSPVQGGRPEPAAALAQGRVPRRPQGPAGDRHAHARHQQRMDIYAVFVYRRERRAHPRPADAPPEARKHGRIFARRRQCRRAGQP